MSSFFSCRVRENHWHSWTGGECPLPEGLKIEVLLRSGATGIKNVGSLNLQWEHYHCDLQTCLTDIIAFKVLGVADGWEY